MKIQAEFRAFNILGLVLCILLLLHFQFSQLRRLVPMDSLVDETAFGSSAVGGSVPQKATTIPTKPVHGKKGRLVEKSEKKCEMEYCHLSQLRLGGPVYLWTMVASSAVDILAHFLEHYIDAGVPPENMNFLINPVGNYTRLDKLYKILGDYGVDVNNSATVHTGRFHSDVKREAVNAFIRTLPNDAWLTYPDLDEFFHYPCRRPDPFESLCGRMVDRIHSLSPNVTIAATDPNPLRRPLSAQFPRCVLVRNAVMQANAKKHMLFRVRPETGFVATMRSSHQLWYHQENATATATGMGVKCRHNKLGLFDHYAWSMEHIHLLYVKAGRYIGDADRTERYSKLIKLVEQNEVTGGWSFSEGASKQLSKNILCCPQPHTTGSGKEAGR